MSTGDEAANVTAVSPARLRWLQGEVGEWVTEGVVSEAAGAAITRRYAASQRFTFVRLVLGLGAVFVGIGLIWLVAANLDEMSPLVRFLAVLLVWLGFMGAAEAPWVRRRRLVQGAVHLLAAAAYGAVVFQAAQSLQVPAYSRGLLFAWGAGALLYAYVLCAPAAVVLGIGVTVVALVWEAADASDSALGFVLAVLAAGLVAASLGVLHEGRWRRWFAAPWREFGVLLTLGGLFAAAMPFVDDESFRFTPLVVGVLVLAAVAGGAAAVIGREWSRWEVLVPAAVLAAGWVLVWWESSTEVSNLSAGDVVQAVLSVLVYLVVSGFYAALGIVRSSWRLTALAMLGLVAFTTVQAFAVFAPILTGAAVFLTVGVVLLATGVLAERGRRGLRESLAEEGA